MRMELEVLSPGVQDRKEADFGPQVLRVSRDRLQGFCRGLEKDAADHLFVLIGNRGDLLRKGKDHMIVGHLQKFRLTVLDPLRLGQALAFGAVAVAVSSVITLAKGCHEGLLCAMECAANSLSMLSQGTPNCHREESGNYMALRARSRKG